MNGAHAFTSLFAVLQFNWQRVTWKVWHWPWDRWWRNWRLKPGAQSPLLARRRTEGRESKRNLVSPRAGKKYGRIKHWRYRTMLKVIIKHIQSRKFTWNDNSLYMISLSDMNAMLPPQLLSCFFPSSNAPLPSFLQKIRGEKKSYTTTKLNLYNQQISDEKLNFHNQIKIFIAAIENNSNLTKILKYGYKHTVSKKKKFLHCGKQNLAFNYSSRLYVSRWLYVFILYLPGRKVIFNIFFIQS